MDRQCNISLGGQVYVVHRARLGGYLSLQAAWSHLEKASKSGDNGAIFEAICSYIRTASPEVSIEIVDTAPWLEIVSALMDIQLLNTIKEDFAIFKVGAGGRGRSLPVPWEYDDRLRYFWVHLIARSYHWNREDIERLWPEDAVAYIQEILAHDQYEHEFMHSLSEVAYQYDKASKRSKYKPLQRPAWMILRDPATLKTRIHKVMLPVGLVIQAGQEEVLH